MSYHESEQFEMSLGDAPARQDVVALGANGEPSLLLGEMAERESEAPVPPPPAIDQNGTSSAPISFYSSVRDIAPSKSIPICELIRMIHNEDTAEGVAQVRKSVTEDEKRQAKTNLPAVQISGYVTAGNRKQAMQEGRFVHSGYLQLDVDDDGLNGKAPEEARRILGADRHVLSAFISPSGAGAKALFRIKPCKTEGEHKQAFSAVEKYIADSYGMKIDPSTKDSARLCFIPSDKDRTWNGETKAFTPPALASPPPLPSAPPVKQRHASKPFPVCPKHGIHAWFMAASWHCRFDGMSAAETIAKIESFDSVENRRPFQPNEVRDAVEKVFASSSPSPGGDDNEGAAAVEPSPAALWEKAFSMRFNPEEVPPPDELCMAIGDVPIAARGNLTVIQGKAKVGKSAVIAAILAASQLGNRSSTGDTFQIKWIGEAEGAILHLDTEQSLADWHGLVSRSVKRSCLPAVSPELVSISLVRFTRSQRLSILREGLKALQATHGRIRVVILDGIADLCTSPNDEAEALELVSAIHALAQEFKTAVFCVLHENPSASDGKTRGHLGSELNRKAVANLRLDKDSDGVTTIYGTDMRKRDLPAAHGHCFAWDDLKGMHTYQGRAGKLTRDKKDDRKRAKTEKEWKPVFECLDERAATLEVSGLQKSPISNSLAEICAATLEVWGEEKSSKPPAVRKRLQEAECLGVVTSNGKNGVVQTWTFEPLN
jgi:hypothetical protein